MSATVEETQAAAVEANHEPSDPPLRDNPPRRRKKTRSQAQKKRRSREEALGGKPPSKAAANRALQSSLGQLLALPAVPAALLTPTAEGKEFLAGHFAASAGPTAAQLVELSEQSPELRAILQSITTASVTMSLAMLGIGYLGPPVLWLIGRHGEAEAMEAVATMTPEQLAERAMAGVRSPDGASQNEASEAARFAREAAVQASASRPSPSEQ